MAYRPAVVPAGAKLTVTGNVIAGNHHIQFNTPKPAAVHITAGTNSDGWLKYYQDNNTVEVRLANGWFTLNPAAIEDKHPLELGLAINTESKADLTEIRELYENHIKNSPFLQKLRREYDILAEKHELFDAIKGDDDVQD